MAEIPTNNFEVTEGNEVVAKDIDTLAKTLQTNADKIREWIKRASLGYTSLSDRQIIMEDLNRSSTIEELRDKLGIESLWGVVAKTETVEPPHKDWVKTFLRKFIHSIGWTPENTVVNLETGNKRVEQGLRNAGV